MTRTIKRKANPSRSAGRTPATVRPALALPPTGFVRLPVVLALIPVSKTTWWAGIKEGRFPAGVRLGRNLTAWRAEEIRSLIERLSGQGG